MRFAEVGISGAFLIEPVPVEDERGDFSRVLDEQALKERGLEWDFGHYNLSRTRRMGTIRGLHYQASPFEEIKVVWCLSGAVFDVIVDLRPQSPTFMKWRSVELSEKTLRLLYVPKGCAHGFQTLAPSTNILYFMSSNYHPSAAKGVRWNDPAFSIPWPDNNPFLSERDRTFPDISV